MGILTDLRIALKKEVILTRQRLLGLIVVAFICFGLITIQVRALSEAQGLANLRTTQLIAKEAELLAYETALVQREGCLTRLEFHDRYRRRFESANFSLRRIIDVATQGSEQSPIVAELYNVINEEAEAIATELAPIPIETCPRAPVRPASDD